MHDTVVENKQQYVLEMETLNNIIFMKMASTVKLIILKQLNKHFSTFGNTLLADKGFRWVCKTASLLS